MSCLVDGTFCPLSLSSSLLSVGFPDGSGVYYWQNGSRNDKAKVRLETSEDDKRTELYVMGVSGNHGSDLLDLKEKARPGS